MDQQQDRLDHGVSNSPLYLKKPAATGSIINSLQIKQNCYQEENTQQVINVTLHSYRIQLIWTTLYSYTLVSLFASWRNAQLLIFGLLASRTFGFNLWITSSQILRAAVASAALPSTRAVIRVTKPHFHGAFNLGSCGLSNNLVPSYSPCNRYAFSNK